MTAGRPKVDISIKKKVTSVRLKSSDKKLLEKLYGSVQKAIDELIRKLKT